MKKKELTKLRDKDVKALLKLANDKKKELAEAYSKTRAGQEKNLKTAKNLKNDIAQILTLVKEKEIIASQENTKETK